MVPGMGGSSHVFYELSTIIARERPLYGLDAVGVNGDVEPHDSIALIAKHNVACLLQTKFKGSSILIGYSLGACVAFEMAKLLELETRKILTLIVIDGSPYLSAVTKVALPKERNLLNMELGFSKIAKKQANIIYEPDDVKVKKIIVIQSQENERNLMSEWQKYSRNLVEHHYVPGDHFSMLRRPFVSVVGKIINASIEY